MGNLLAHKPGVTSVVGWLVLLFMDLCIPLVCHSWCWLCVQPCSRTAALLRWSSGHKLVITPVRGRGRYQNWPKEEVELQCRPDKGELRTKDCQSSFMLGWNAPAFLPSMVWAALGRAWPRGKAAPEGTDTWRLLVDEAVSPSSKGRLCDTSPCPPHCFS